MKRDDLKQMEADQRAYARKHGRNAVMGIDVVDVRPIYADLELPSGFGVQRKDSPLHVLSFMYPAVVVFIPPSSQELIERRFGMSLETLVELQDKGILKPLIGHPTDYADLPHLDSILKRKPASVWARGDELAHSFANAGEYWRDARRVIPLKKIHSVKWVRDKWRTHYPNLGPRQLLEQIDIEVCTNYVNLRIFGEHKLAEWALSTPNPSEVVKRLLALNEFIAYPHLLGIGGTLNYGIEESTVQDVVQGLSLISGERRRVDASATLLLSALKIEFPEPVMADAVIEMHKLGVGKRLQQAVRALEDELVRVNDEEYPKALNELTVTAQETIQRTLSEARGLTYEMARGATLQNVAMAMKAGTLAGVAAAVFSVGTAAGTIASTVAGTVAGIIASGLAGTTVANFLGNPPFRKYLEKGEERLTDAVMARRFSPLATHLWWVDRLRDQSKRGKG